MAEERLHFPQIFYITTWLLFLGSKVWYFSPGWSSPHWTILFLQKNSRSLLLFDTNYCLGNILICWLPSQTEHCIPLKRQFLSPQILLCEVKRIMWPWLSFIMSSYSYYMKILTLSHHFHKLNYIHPFPHAFNCKKANILYVAGMMYWTQWGNF